jgi:uncharacterized protein DUF2510
VSLRKKLAERARPYLEPGEHIQAVFKAQSGASPYWQGLIAGLVVFVALNLQAIFHAGFLVTEVGVVVALMIAFSVLFRVHHVVVTDRAIVVLDASMWTNRPTRLRLRHPRNFYFGRMSRIWGKFVLDNTKYWVHRRFHKDVAAADADAGLTLLMQRRQPGPAAAESVQQQPRSFPPAGWYPDPAGSSAKRYWDGDHWGPSPQQARPY